MQTSRGFLGQQFNKIQRRNSFPPVNTRTYKVASYKDLENLRTENKTTHMFITNDETTINYGILTSAKKPKPEFTPTVIDTINYKGENKSQSIAPFKTPRTLSLEIVKENPKITQYIANKEAMLDEILSTVKKVKPIKLVHKSYFGYAKR